MKIKFAFIVPAVIATAALSFFLIQHRNQSSSTGNQQPVAVENEEDDDREVPASYQYLRLKYEMDMIKDPESGTIPDKIFDKEAAFARTIPERSLGNGRLGDLNSYIPAGPNNIGGRTRAVAYDIRYNGGSNQVILAGGVSGGIFRSTDGGANWTRVSPEGHIHNVSVLKQDPRPGFQDTWYAGTGEPIGNSASEIGSFILGNGFFQSSDNGVTWVRLSTGGEQGLLDRLFDMVYNIAVSPVNGDIYFAVLGNLYRYRPNSTPNLQIVFQGSFYGGTDSWQTDVICAPSGRVYFALNGGSIDVDGSNNIVQNSAKRGVWTSASGDSASYTRIAGGPNGSADSVAGWRGNDYNGGAKRIMMALAPSNPNSLYVLYENGFSNSNPDFKPEVDLFKYDVTTSTWSNRSANMPDFPGGNNASTDPITVQGGYDMFLAIKPDNENVVFIGGSSLYRSTDGFTTTANTTWAGGYGSQTVTAGAGLVFLYPNGFSHADIHNLAFNPSNANEAICANDGGIQKTTNISAAGNDGINWINLNNYQTLQYYYATIDPETGKNNFVGGSQDNGTQFRDKTGVIGSAVADSNNHRRINAGDGSAVGYSKITGGNQYVYSSVQLGDVYRTQLITGTLTRVKINPTSGLTTNPAEPSGYGEFTTNFKLDPDNTEDLYYINFNRLYRTTSASTATSASWTELTGVSSAVSPTNGSSVAIRSIAFTRGAYNTSHSMYIGTTNGKIFRLDDPRNAAAGTAPVNISPSGLSGLNVQDIAVNPNDDNEIIAVASNYTVGSGTGNAVNIWWTNNAKSASPTWKSAEGNLSGSINSGYISGRSAVIIVKKDASNNPVTEYYVGTAAGLYSVVGLGTTLAANGSPSWQREGGNILNLAVIASMAYRPVDNVLLIATHGNGLYYTSLGTPNFNPPAPTGIDPIINDKSFIKAVYPTVADQPVQFTIGNRFEIKKITIQVFNTSGQELYRKEAGYQNGSVDFNNYPHGTYILSIISDNKKYKNLQKIIR